MASETSTNASEIESWPLELMEEFNSISLKDVNDYLNSKIDRLNKRIETLYEIEKNNLHEEVPTEDDQIEEYIRNSRLKKMSSLAEALKDENLLDYVPFPAHLNFNIVTELKREINELETLLVKNKKELVDSKEELASLENKIKSLNEIVEKRRTEGEMAKDKSFEALKRAVQQEFLKHKRELNQLLNDLYPDDKGEIRKVLMSVVDKYFEEGDGYIQLTTNIDYRCLEFLFEADVLERHPYAQDRIKLAKLTD